MRRGRVNGNFRIPSVYEVGGASGRKLERRSKFQEKVSHLLVGIDRLNL